MPLYYNRPTNTRWFFLKESLDGNYKIPKANIIFLGESRLNAGINFSKIQNSYSFASGGSAPIEMYFILKKYLQKYQKPDTVFLSISPRFFTEIFAFWHFAVRNKLIGDSEINEILSEKEKQDTVLGSFAKANYFLYKADYLGYYQDDVLYNYIIAAYSENKKLIDTMIIMNGGRPHAGLKDSCSDLNYETKYSHFIPSPLLENYFDKTLALCKEKNINLIFFSLPMNESSFKVLNRDFVKEYSLFMKKYSEKYPGFNISDSIFYYHDKFFGDASHLNLKGRKKYSDWFLKNYIKFK